MIFEKIEALEVRVKQLVDILQDLKQTNSVLHRELEQARQQLIQHEMFSHDWEEERTHIRTRIEKVLDDLHCLEIPDPDKDLT